MSELRFYLDGNIPKEVPRQLGLSGIDAVSAHSLGKLAMTTTAISIERLPWDVYCAHTTKISCVLGRKLRIPGLSLFHRSRQV